MEGLGSGGTSDLEERGAGKWRDWEVEGLVISKSEGPGSGGTGNL